MLPPEEIVSRLNGISKSKASMPITSLIILGFLAGAFIAFAAQGSTVAANDIPTFGATRLITAVVFPVGLMLVILAGAELFTGNSLMSMGVMSRAIGVGGLLRNWVVVYIANFLGSITMVYLMNASGLWHWNGSRVGLSVVNIALGKVSLTFTEAVVRGILCNWIVCLAVWIATGVQEVAGRILGMSFPIMLFVLSGFEHSIANMYYIPAGILAAADPMIAAIAEFPSAATTSGVLTWGSFFGKNLLPVTLGNLVGGVIFVSMLYWIVYGRAGKAKAK